MTVQVIAPSAEKRQLVPGGTWGNLKQNRGAVTLAALAQNEQAGLIRVPAFSYITQVSGTNAQLGAGSVLEIGYEAVDGSPGDPDAFADVADGNVAGGFNTPFAPVYVTEDVYITVKNTGAGAATGDVTVTCQYEYVGT